MGCSSLSLPGILYAFFPANSEDDPGQEIVDPLQAAGSQERAQQHRGHCHDEPFQPQMNIYHMGIEPGIDQWLVLYYPWTMLYVVREL